MMTPVLMAWVALGQAAQAQPATDLTLHTIKQPGIELRFVDFHWRPELFEAMEKGGGTIPEAQRNWMLARIVTTEPFKVGGTRVRAGNYALALWPNLDGRGLALELRDVDMRTVLEPNVIAPAPNGKTIYKGPARFETTPDTAPRLDIQLIEGAGVVSVAVRYGNRKLSLAFTR
jgi:hypothetical protein